MNRTLFFGSYTRTDSYFEGGELASSGLPQGKELEILEPYPRQAAAELFTQEFKLPVYDTPQADARESAAGRRSVRRGRLGRSRAASWSTPRPASRSSSNFSATTRPTSVSPRPYRQSAPAWHRRHAAHRRHQPVRQPRPQFRFRRRDCGSEPVGIARQRAARLLEFAGRRHARIAQSMPASRTRSSTRWSTASFLPPTATTCVAATHALDRVLLWNFYVVPQ